MFQTGIIVTIDGTESRGRALRYARGKWEVGLVNRDEEAARTLNTFFRVVAIGRLNTFLFKDRGPGEARGINEVFGAATRLASTHSARLLCRSLDVLHVAAALQLHCRQVVSADERQLALAVSAGLAGIDLRTRNRTRRPRR